jgi:uncharacterized membrane protein HdeD (DUF308 family)
MEQGTGVATAAHPQSGGLFNQAHWSLRMMLGVLWVGLGLVALSKPIITTFSTTLFFGWLLLIAGIAHVLVTLFSWKKNGMLGFLTGILFIMFGMMLVNNLIVGTIALTSLMGVFFLMQGVLSLVAAFYEERQFMVPLLVVGLFSLLFGFLIFSNFLVASTGLIGLLLGWMFVLDGFGMIATASFASNDPGAAQKILGIVVFLFLGYFMISRLLGWNEAPKPTPVPLPAEVEMRTQ